MIPATSEERAQADRLLAIRDRIGRTDADDGALRALLVLAHEAVRADAAAHEAERAADERDWTVRAVPAPRTLPSFGAEAYADLLDGVARQVRRHVAAGARLLVVSKGDDALLVPGYDAAHFPQGPSGGYAGHYPADSDAAVAHLEQCRAGGAEYFVLPSTAYWWLDYYAGLARHLLAAGRVLAHDEHCLILDLRPPSEGGTSA